MPRQVKSKVVEQVAEQVKVEPEVKVELSQSKAESSKVSKSRKSKPVAEEVVELAAPAVLEEPSPASQVVSLVAEVTELPETEAGFVETSGEFFSKLQQLGLLVSAIKVEYKTLEKKWSRELKNSQKKNSKNKRKTGNRAPSGFVKPTKISDELATFLEKPSGSEMARTEVTRDINKYIRANNLQDANNGRKINPDTKLATLLKLTKTDELTYFNLQRYMSPHFAKAVKPVVAVEQAVSV
jgi:chromatin remodeling complex protein RSC6